MKLDKPFVLGKGAVALLCDDCISQGAGILKNVTEKNVVTTAEMWAGLRKPVRAEEAPKD